MNTISSVDQTRLVSVDGEQCGDNKSWNLTLISREDVLGQGRQTLVRHNGRLVGEMIEGEGRVVIARVHAAHLEFTYSGRSVNGRDVKTALQRFCVEFL